MGFPDHQMCNSHRMHLLRSLAVVFVRCRTISFPVGVANFAKPHDSASIRCKKKKANVTFNLKATRTQKTSSPTEGLLIALQAFLLMAKTLILRLQNNGRCNGSYMHLL